MVYRPEAARERDLHRLEKTPRWLFLDPWLDAQNLAVEAEGRATNLVYEGYKPKSSRDKALTAFAQLAALRLDARRAMVSLIDSTRQYILAEATKTLSLVKDKADRDEDQVWLGNTIIAKLDAVCYHVFSSTYTALEENGDIYTAECLVVPDCRLDPRFAHRDYVTMEHGVRFYAGVPITTKAGYHIGVYAISDDSPRAGLSAAEIRFMQDVAAAVMEHLELAKDSGDRNKGERMIRGLTEFIERSSLQETRNESSNSRFTTMEKQTENSRLKALAEDGEAGAVAVSAKPVHRKREGEKETGTSRIFHRAARIIRQSIYADGVVFFDTSTIGVKGHVYEDPDSSDESSKQTTTDFDTADSAATGKRRKTREKIFGPSKEVDPRLESQEGLASVPANSKVCPIIALSLNSSGTVPSLKDFCFTEAGMERYIRRYPHGKFFNFNEDGMGFNSSDERSEKSETDNSDNRTIQAVSPTKPRKRKDRFIPTEFLEVLPNVRTLIFMPLWDPASERWIAGAFIWTYTTGSLLSPENELPYLKAFSNSITSEVARSNAQKSDRAKTTFIASISHELRSPLHGILGSVEFLHDTVSSAYQESLVSSIETCGKTLLDTIDHVLDYAKINKLRNASSRRRRAEGRRRGQPGDNSILGVTTDFNLAHLVEEVCDTVCAGHNFRKTHVGRRGAFHDHYDIPEANSSDNVVTAVQEGKEDRVAVTLNITPFVNWIVRSQPGALRRIVMNLLGNSLKYTQSGFITVSLRQEDAGHQSVQLTLVVEDSGKGMSPEYQRTKLFAPFSQEDPFSSGTGLGLSIVKQIVESLNGEIEVKSTLNVGTTTKVSLRLPGGQSKNMWTSQKLIQSPEALEEKTASIIFPRNSLGGAGHKIKESLWGACRGFRIKLSEDFNLSSGQPDFLITESDSLDMILVEQAVTRAHMPPLAVICICTDQVEKSAIESRISRHVAALGWIAEVVAQPCGPRKLARVLLDSQTRAARDQQERSLSRSASIHPGHQLAPSEPRTLVHRSISDMVQENSPVAATIADLHSPLVSFSMPARSAIEPFSTPLSPSTDQGGTPSQESISYFPPRVLLVDDNAINLKLLVVFAKRQNILYSEAVNGLEALNTFKEASVASTSSTPVKPFDFVLMDLSMPVMDGLESTRLIRQFETENELGRCTIIALTGLASAQDQQDAVDAGVDMYLVKPVKFKDIQRIFGGR
ncbi:hypothetical protein CC78DRAFT_540513 [Lojkania enalia]|uniref:histidine kinase n=1 Tax=Lojkania enalia TaxID=147567 RepID=A0A9P4KIK8_9PLEO|nr:hypothetical protein CC78DRAFT_540513 [Didymosphaeria enalia]